MIHTAITARALATERGYQIKSQLYTDKNGCLLYDGSRLVARYIGWDQLVAALPKHPDLKNLKNLKRRPELNDAGGTT